MQTRALIVVLIAAAALVSGCQTAGPGVMNKFGTINATLSANPPEAAQSALEALNLADIEVSSTGLDSQATARTAQGSEVSIFINKAGERVSRVTIRVGQWGDQQVSMQILERIQSDLSGDTVTPLTAVETD